jgi:Lrp/AsnC family leucine-responsive transcriptional regulator
VVDADALGYGVVAFVFVDNAAFDVPDFTERLEAIPNVLECHAVAGEWAYLLKIRAESTADLERVLHLIRKVDDVNRTQSVIGLSTAFETTTLPMPVVAEDGEEPPQLATRRKSA